MIIILKVVRLSASRTGRLYPQKSSCNSFLLGAESTPGPWYGADGPGRPLRFAEHRQPLCWNFMYHSRVVLFVGGSMRYMVRNLRCIVTIDSVLANSKTQNAFLFTVHAIFRHYYPLAVEPASTPRPLVQKKNFERFSTY